VLSGDRSIFKVCGSNQPSCLGDVQAQSAFCGAVALKQGYAAILLRARPRETKGIAQSLTGQFHQRFSEQFDLMIKGKGLNELKKYLGWS
jgi:hypothetical protein